MRFVKSSIAAAAAVLAFAAQATPVVTVNSNATQLANALAGTGITVVGATLTNANAGASGTFTNGGTAVGFDTGVLLTTGDAACVASATSGTFCSGGGATTELSVDFSSNTGQFFFQYVFASEEYNEFVGSGFNDLFQLLLDDTTNLALVPGGGGVVSINNVNCGSNSAFYRNNSTGATCANLNLDIAYDGLTVVLTASGTVAANTTHNFKFRIADVGDSAFDSGVFIRGGSFSTSVPEPGSLALVGATLFGLAAARRRKA